MILTYKEIKAAEEWVENQNAPSQHIERGVSRLIAYACAAYAKHVNGWRGIESAPKDEEDVLLCFDRYEVDIKGRIISPEMAVGKHHNGAWYSDSSYYVEYRLIDPLYWMPLPQPPETLRTEIDKIRKMNIKFPENALEEIMKDRQDD